MEDETSAVINRRDFLTLTTAAVVAVGVGFTAVSFLKVLSPTRDIVKASVMDVGISGFKEGNFQALLWRKLAMWPSGLALPPQRFTRMLMEMARAWSSRLFR